MNLARPLVNHCYILQSNSGYKTPYEAYCFNYRISPCGCCLEEEIDSSESAASDLSESN